MSSGEEMCDLHGTTTLSYELSSAGTKIKLWGISSVSEMTLHIFFFLTSVHMWEIILSPVSSDVNGVFGRKPPNKSQKHTPYFWSKCYIIVCTIILCSPTYHLILVSSRPHCLESLIC